MIVGGDLVVVVLVCGNGDNGGGGDNGDSGGDGDSGGPDVGLP